MWQSLATWEALTRVVIALLMVMIRLKMLGQPSSFSRIRKEVGSRADLFLAHNKVLSFARLENIKTSHKLNPNIATHHRMRLLHIASPTYEMREGRRIRRSLPLKKSVHPHARIFETARAPSYHSFPDGIALRKHSPSKRWKCTSLHNQWWSIPMTRWPVKRRSQKLTTCKMARLGGY